MEKQKSSQKLDPAMAGKKTLLKWILGLYALWWVGLLIATYFFLVDQLLIGDIIYFAVICVVGIILPYHLFHKFKIGWKEMPKNMTMGFLISSVILVVVAFIVGMFLMGGVGKDIIALEYLAEIEALKLINLILILIPTSLAYAIFFYGFIQEAWEYIFGKSRGAIFKAVFLTAIMFGITHLTAIEDWSDMNKVIIEVGIMTILSMGLGLYFHYFNSIFFVYISFLTIKWFTTVPGDVIHRDFPLSLLGIAVLLTSFILYYIFIGRKGSLKDFKLKFKFK